MSEDSEDLDPVHYRPGPLAYEVFSDDDDDGDGRDEKDKEECRGNETLKNQQLM